MGHPQPPFWPIQQPGDLVQIDTKEVRPARGVVLKHFSARDVVSRWDVVEVHARATSLAAVNIPVVAPFTGAARLASTCQCTPSHPFAAIRARLPRSVPARDLAGRRQPTRSRALHGRGPLGLHLPTRNLAHPRGLPPPLRAGDLTEARPFPSEIPVVLSANGNNPSLPSPPRAKDLVE